MSTISKINFNRFFTENLDLSSNLITANLNTFSRYNIFSRIASLFIDESFDKVKICENIFCTLGTTGKTLTLTEKTFALENLRQMKVKFAKSDQCIITIQRIEDLINGKKEPLVSSKTSTGSSAPHKPAQPVQNNIKTKSAPQKPVTQVPYVTTQQANLNAIKEDQHKIITRSEQEKKLPKDLNNTADRFADKMRNKSTPTKTPTKRLTYDEQIIGKKLNETGKILV